MSTHRKAYFALAVICTLWGATYTATRIGVSTIPPFLFAGIRQSAAGLILLLALLLSKKKEWLSAKDIWKQALPGVLMLVPGNAVIGWAEQFIPSGLAALIVAAMPLYIILISCFTGRNRQQLNTSIATGLLLGLAGILLIFKDNLSDLAHSPYLMGMLGVFGASLCWAIGTVYIKSSVVRTGPVTNAAIQFSSGGLVLLLLSPLLDDYSRIHTVAPESIWSLIYLIFFGSIIPYMCYLYAIRHLQVGIVSTYAYVNPFIAIILGALILNEQVTWITGLAFAATAAGIYYINRGHAANQTIQHGKNTKLVRQTI